MLIPLSFRFLLLYGEGDFFRVESHMDVSPKIYQVSIRYGRGIALKVVVLFCSECLIYGTPENDKFELMDFIIG